MLNHRTLRESMRELGVGQRVFVTWDYQSDPIEDVQAVVKRIRATGALVTGCSYDAQVAKGTKCPACGADGGLDLAPEPDAAA